jgi:hypothetical protein
VEHSDTLLTIAEIAVAFAGFSSIVVVFQNRDSGSWEPLDFIRYRSMLVGSLMTALFTAVPLVVSWLAVPPSLVWRVSSAAMLLWFAVIIVVQFRIRSFFPSRAGQVRWVAFILTSSSAAACLGLNALGIAFQGTAEPFMVGITWILFLSGWQFYQLVALPASAGGGPTV